MSNIFADNGDEGMNCNILKIRLAMESKRYDVMVQRVEDHLKETFNERKNLRDNNISNSVKKEEENKKKQNQNKDKNDKVEEEKDNEAPWEHVDEHNNKYKKAYDHKQDQGDSTLDKATLKKDFNYIYKILQELPVFKPEELELIACAFKSQLKEVRMAIKSIDILQTKQKFDSKGTSMEQYKKGLIYDMIQKGQKQVKIITQYCQPVIASANTYIFFKKLEADIYRYLAEHTQNYIDPKSHHQGEEETGQFREECKKNAHNAYREAKFMQNQLSDFYAVENRDQIDTIRLGLFLNYAVFLWEIVQSEDQKKKALRMLKREIQNALDDFDKWKDDEREMISQQVELIQENINLWKKDVDTDSAEEN